MHAYQQQNSEMSLCEGLAEFRRVEGLEEKMTAVREETRQLMDRHDIVHVIFGMDTSLRQEAMVDIWTVFGTTASLADLIGYLRLPEERAIIFEIGYWTGATTAVRSVPDVFRVAKAARKLTKKWPWEDHDQWLDRPLSEIRREFGVTLLAA